MKVCSKSDTGCVTVFISIKSKALDDNCIGSTPELGGYHRFSIWLQADYLTLLRVYEGVGFQVEGMQPLSGFQRDKQE